MDRKEAINTMVGSVFKDTDTKCLKCLKDTRKCLEIIEENVREEAIRKFADWFLRAFRIFRLWSADDLLVMDVESLVHEYEKQTGGCENE